MYGLDNLRLFYLFLGNQSSPYKSDCGNFLSPHRKDLNTKMPTEGKGINLVFLMFI